MRIGMHIVHIEDKSPGTTTDDVDKSPGTTTDDVGCSWQHFHLTDFPLSFNTSVLMYTSQALVLAPGAIYVYIMGTGTGTRC